MKEKLLYKTLIVLTVLALVGCTHVQPTVVNHAVSTDNEKTVNAVPANLVLCQRALKIASDELAYAKQQAKKNHVFTDWTGAVKSLSAANAAFQAQDYESCVMHAKAVNTFIERNKNYMQWRRSLNL